MIKGSIGFLIAVAVSVAYADAVVIPKRLKPDGVAKLDEPFQDRFDKMWEEYENAVQKAIDSLNDALNKELKKAKANGNLDLVLMWQQVQNKFATEGKLDWDDDPIAWKDKHKDAAFPAEFKRVVTQTAKDLAAAEDRLLKGLKQLEKDLVQAGKLDQAILVRAVILQPEPIDLLHGLNVVNGRVQGQWHLVQGNLVGGGPINGNQIPEFRFDNKNANQLAGQDYDLIMEFSVKSDNTGLADVIPKLPGVPAHLFFRNQRNGLPSKIYFHQLVPEAVLGFRFQPNQRYTAVIEVRRKGQAVNVSLDNVQVLRWKGPGNKPVENAFSVIVSPGAELTLSKFVVKPAN